MKTHFIDGKNSPTGNNAGHMKKENRILGNFIIVTTYTQKMSLKISKE
jgi:hypothetical protein